MSEETNVNIAAKQTKKPTKAERARALLKEGRSIKEVAAMLGTSLQYVYSLRYVDKKKAKTKRSKRAQLAKEMKPVLPSLKKPGRPKGSKNKTDLQKLRKAVDGITPPEVKKEAEPDAQWKSFYYISNPRPNLWTRIKAVFTGRYE